MKQLQFAGLPLDEDTALPRLSEHTAGSGWCCASATLYRSNSLGREIAIRGATHDHRSRRTGRQQPLSVGADR
jgi:hypothetical protein